MFRHVVLFRFAADAGPGTVALVDSGLRALETAIDSIRTYRFGADAGINPGNYDYAVVADFDDEAGYLHYRDHPAHQEFIATVLAPVLAERAAVQFPISG